MGSKPVNIQRFEDMFYITLTNISNYTICEALKFKHFRQPHTQFTWSYANVKSPLCKGNCCNISGEKSVWVTAIWTTSPGTSNYGVWIIYPHKCKLFPHPTQHCFSVLLVKLLYLICLLNKPFAFHFGHVTTNPRPLP